MSDERLTDVESALAFQEQAISDLSDVVRRQQQEIDRLKAQLASVVEQMAEDADAKEAGAAFPAEERPPHY
jgi:SlyX protein